MGNSVSSAEQFESHLNRQQDLIKRLDNVIQKSAERLQSAGSLAIDYTIDGDGQPEEQNEDARALISNLYNKSRDLNSATQPPAEPPLSEDELSQLQVKPEPIKEYNADALVYKPWLKSLAEPDNATIKNNGVDGTAPFAADDILLARAIGYSGSMLRSAAFMDANTVVYAVGGVAVVQDTRSLEQRFFREHSSTISTIAVHPGRRVVATAELGFLPVIHIWNIDTLERIITIADQFRTGLTSMKFSADGSQLAAVDYSDDHLLGVYNWETGRIIATAQHHTDIFDLSFITGEHMSSEESSNHELNDPRIVTVGDRAITFWSTGDDDDKLHGSPALLGNAGKKQAFTAVCVSGQNVVVGTQNGELYLFQRQKLLRVLDVQSRMITCLVSSNNTSLVTCAGYDGVVSTYNISSFKKVHTHTSFYDHSTAPIFSLDVIANNNGSNNSSSSSILVGDTNNTLVIVDEHSTSTNNNNSNRLVLQGGAGAHVGDNISTFAVHPTKMQLATGGVDYQVVEWDIEQLMTMRNENNDTSKIATGILRTHRIPAHATCCTYSPSLSSAGGVDDTLLAVGLSNGTICIFSGAELTHSFSLGKRRVQCCKFSSNGRLLAAGTADNVVEVFDVTNSFAHICQLPSLSGVVINIDFASNDNVLRVATQAYELVYFDIQKRARIEDTSSIITLLWGSHTSLFGWEVQGIWRLDSEFNDVNAVSRSHNRKHLATAETSGTVKLFKYPCVGGGLDENGVLQRRPDSNRLKGHVSNVLGVGWFGGDKFVATAGSDSVFVWKI